jgi:hypothetical protein
MTENRNSNRHEILNDPLFWTRLASHACGWLRGSEDKSLRRFWIDDFLPESATDTKRGVDVTGTAWIGEGPRAMHPFRFIVSVPQNMLHRNRDHFAIEQLMIDDGQRTLQIQILSKDTFERHEQRAQQGQQEAGGGGARD